MATNDLAATLASAQAATGPGPWCRVRNVEEARTFQVTIAGVATVAIEASNDGINPIPLQVGVTTSAGFTDDGAWGYVRSNVTSYTSGSVTVIMGERAVAQ
jgi:hypothetical protein